MEIPEDIRKAAGLAFDEMRSPANELAGLCEGDGERKHDVDLIARAILAERERCAKIAEDEDGHFTWSGTDRNVRLLQQCASEIAAAILNPEEET